MIRKTVKTLSRYREVIADRDGRTLMMSENGRIETWWLLWIIPLYSREVLY